ncbi:hypothetical protein [Amniculibacterium aquaticum]|uniref:hypothetical protein n=1 Tax=Amniculibacterium aquaticum TaxID=2479858 RepID=UPI000F5B3C2A|nr:hypothetical protein [Amniculibacterium aquaticum]
MKPQAQPNNHDHHDSVISYKQLRMFIGLLGFLLTFLLILTTFILGDSKVFKISISHYYYSFGHIIFVGSLCIMGGLFLTYRGKDRWENRVSNLSGAFAIGVAAFPTKLNGYEGNEYLSIFDPFYRDWMNIVHFACAFCLFLSFSIFCLSFFQKSDEDISEASTEDMDKKKNRNMYYRICGIGILLSIALIAFFSFIVTEKDHPNSILVKYSTIIFESTALFFFSTSWLMKSSDILSPKIPFMNYFR